MIAVDTSVVVAGFASWHEGHRSALDVLVLKPRVPAHVLLESYSVLTRLPPPHRAPADVVLAFLTVRFRDVPLTLPGRSQRALLREAVAAGVSGGAIYDALIAATAKHARARLLSRDRRAAALYERLAVEHELLS